MTLSSLMGARLWGLKVELILLDLSMKLQEFTANSFPPKNGGMVVRVPRGWHELIQFPMLFYD